MSSIVNKYLQTPTEVGVVAVGFSGGQQKDGVDIAPQALIDSGLLTTLRDDLNYTIHHDGVVHTYTKLFPTSDPPLHVSGAKMPMLKPQTVSNATEALSSQVYEHAKEGRLVLTLGGDHSIAVGSISGVAKAVRERLDKEIAVIWVDAHADINSPQTSGSGNIHGMPVSYLCGFSSAPAENPSVFGWLEKNHLINPKKLVYIALRDVDFGEKKILRENGIKAFSMHDVDKHGIGKVMEMALEYVGDSPVHLSFDVDALDPMWAPSTGTPVRGGLTLREGDYICECVHETGLLVAMDLVEVNPNIGPRDGVDGVLGAAETVRAGSSLVRCALGESLL
ncbi:Similar to Arginase; acc. no. P33280 [Pyronema omphalodes CBS 100304]|uniref:Arginase n=1 Tax=Pyronema omphalodes (strain CBS 100304) TaxID=1076935 RepID=U4L676_PYROM|nr:Similar to Arginase; acc. no. P33280 [Pyronema omphalodes CBS 100304]